MSNGTDPIVKALKEGRLRAPNYNRRNLVAARTTAFPFKKLGKYDKGITSAIYEGALDQDPLKLQEYYRGEMQSGAKKLLNGIVSRGASIVPKVGQGFGHVIGTGAAILSGDAFKGDWTLAFDNPIAEAFANMDEGLKEMAPVYMSQQYGEGNLLQKMGTATFWASDFADGVAFLASAYAPGWGIGKLGQMVKGASKLKMLAGLKKIGIDSNSLTVGASSIYNTISEAGVEAYHVNKDLRQELIAAGVPEEEARMRAGEAAAETFGFNMATLWLSNIPQSQWFHGNVKNRHNKLKNLIRNGETSAGELNKRYTWWKSALKGAATEGLWEENLQTSIERYEKRFTMGETDAEWLSGIFGEAWTNVKGFVKTFSPFHDAPAAGSPEDQGATSIALGMLIGAPMSSYAEYREHIGEQDELKQIQDWWKSNIDYTSMGLKAFAEDVKAPYKTFTKEVTTKNEDGKETTTTVPSMLNDKNRTEEDPNKIANIMMRHLANKKYFDESVIAAIKNDAIHDGFNKHLAFASFVHSLYSNPNMEIEDIEQAINQAIKSTEQSEEARDLKVNEFIQDNMQLARQYYQALEEIDSKISGDFDFKEDPAAQSFKRNFRKSLLYAKVKQNVGQEIANNSTDEKLTNAANNIVDDATTFLEGAYKNRQKIWGAYSKFYERFMEATKNAKEATEDKEQYKNGYWAKELSETLNVTKVEHPEFWTAEPLVANQDARKTATNPHTIRERNAANRGQMYLDNNAAQNAMDQEGPIDQIAEKLADLPELTTETKNKAQKFLGRIEETKKANQEKIDELQTLHDDLQDGIGWEYVDELIGGKATQQDVTKALIQIRRDLLDLKNENETLDAYQKDVEYALGSNKKLKPNMKPLPIQFLEQELGPVDALINAFERNPSEFARLQETLNAIAQVKALIEFFTERKDTTKRIKDRALVLLQQRLNKLNKAEVAAAENTQNKANANLIKEQQKVRSLMSALNYNERFFNTELTKLIKGAVDTDEWEKLNKEYEKSEGVPYPNSYAAMLSLIEAIRDHETSKEVIKGIKDSRKKTLQQFADAADVTDNMTSSYADAPHAVIFTLLSNYIQRSLGIRNAFNDPNLPFYNWKKTNDIYALRDELAKDPKYAQLLYITTLHIDYTAAGTILDYLESNTSYKDIFEGVHKNIDEDLTPSIEQMMAATEIVAALLNKQVDDDYANAVYLRGPAGSGKTTIVANLVLKTFKSLTETGDSQIMISGHKKTSADNLAKELDMKVTYLEELAEADLSSTKLVVIDEAAGMLPLQMNAIAEKIQNHNKTVSNDKEKIRLFLLGDPSQITRQDTPLALRSGHTVDPITVIYRTSVGAVENAFMEFKDNPNKVENLLVQSSHTVMEAKSNNESLFGVMAGTAIDMIDVIKARPLADGRRRAVIVNHENNKAPYEGLGVEVLTYEEAQGETIDEVYLDLNRNKTDFRGNQFEDDLEFNTAVYTAMSRAKFFVYTNVPGITSTKSANLNQDTSSNKDLFEALKEQYSDYFDAHQYFLSEINGKELDTTPSETEEPPATPDEVVDEEVPEEPPSGPPTPEDKDVAETAPQKGSEESVSEGEQVRHSHYMFYPDNAAIGTWLNDPTNELSYTGKGYVIKSKSSSAAGYNLSVVAERSDGKYDVVGVLSDKDFTDGDFGKALTKEWNKVWNDPKHPMGKARGGNSTRFPVSGSSRKIGLTFGDQGPNSFDNPIMEVTIEGISPMDVVLDPEKRFRDMGEGFIQRLLANVYENIFKGAKLKADPKNKALIPGPDGEVDLNKINGDDIRVEIFSHKSADEIAERGNFRPQPGRPYLVIENMLPEGSSRTQSNPFLIPLANLPFSKESKWYQPLANFYEALVQVEEATGLKLGDSTIALENLIRYIAEKNYKGVQHPDGKREIVAADNPMTMADIVKKVDVPVDPEALASVSSQIETLIREGFGVQRKPMVMTEAEFKKSKYNTEEFEWVPFDTTANGRVVGATIDSQTGERTENPVTTPYEYIVVPNHPTAPAQYALSELAKANKEVGNTTIRIGSLSDRKKGKYHILSRTLFRKHRDDEYAFIYGQLRRIYAEEFGKKSSGLSGKAVRKILLTKGLVTEAELQEMEDAYLTPQITSETLRLIVDFPGKYHSTSSQQGPRYLREPIDMYDFNQKFGRNLKSPKARKVVEKLVGSKVVSTNPLSVKISITSDVPASGQSGYTPTIQEITPNAFEIYEDKPEISEAEKEFAKIAAPENVSVNEKLSKLGKFVNKYFPIAKVTYANASKSDNRIELTLEDELFVPFPAGHTVRIMGGGAAYLTFSFIDLKNNLSPFFKLEEKRIEIKENKRKDGWISKKKLNDIVADAGAILDLTDAITQETDKSVKIEEERISIREFEPTVANDPVTEEELIARIKKIDPTVLKETLPLIEGKSESERLAFLTRVFTSINHSGLSDDVDYAYDANRMKKMAKALGKELTEEQAKKLLNRLLPGMELTPDQVRFVSKELMDSMASPEEDLWGLWDRGVMYFAYVERDGQKIFYENVVRHEVFHRIHQAHMSPEERQNLRKLVDAQYDTAGLSDYDYEEWLARKYQSWRAKTFKARGFLRKWFKWVQRLFDWIFSNRNELERLFNKIDYGFFTPSTYRDLAHASRQAMKFIKDDFKKVDVFKEAVNVIRKGFNRYLYIDPKFGGGQNGLVVSEIEAIKLIRQELDQALIKRQAQKAQALETMEIFPEGTATHTKAALTSSMLDLRIAALEVLTRKEDSPFNKVIEYLYPNSIYLSETAAERITEEAFIEEIINGGNDTLTGVAAQIEENETKNHELKLSSSMRHWLSSIMRKKKNKDGTLDLPVSERYAYFQMLQFFQMIELNGMTFELKDLQAQKDYILKNTALGEAGQRVLDRLIQTAEEATQQTYGKYNVEIPRDQNIVFQHNELTGDTTYYFIQGPEASTFSFYDEIKDNPQIKVFKMRSKELLPIFDALNKEGILTDKELFNALYKRTIARDVLRSAQNNFKMKEMDILIGIQSFDFGKSYFRYVKGRTLGLHTSLRSTFQDALYNYILNGHHHKGYNKVKALLESKQYQEGIQEFLNQMGLGFLAKDFQSGNLEQMALTITNTIGEAIEAGENMTPEHLETFIDPETKQEEDIIVDNIQVWLDDNETIVAEFIQALKFNFEWLRNTSVRSGDNKKLYKFSNSSYMHDLLYNLINSSEFQGSPGTQTFRKLPEFLRTEFYRNNPYVQGLARLYDINYHDAYRNDYSKSVRTYDRENKSEWYRREFTFGFIDGLATSKQKATSYHQFTYPLADRTRIPALRTKLLSKEDAKEAIKMAITQIRHRSRSKFFKGYDYTKNTNFEVYDEEAQKMGLDEATEYVFEKLMERGKETAKTLINEQVPVPYNLEKAVNKAKSVWKGLPSVPKNFKYRQGGEYRLTTEMIEPLAQMYEVNTYINSYFLTQLFAGDHAYYGDSVKVVKRMAGPSAPGTAPLVAPEFGMKARAKLAIVADKAIPFENEDKETPSIVRFLNQFLTKEQVKQVKDYFSAKGFDMTDAQGFLTPARKNDLLRGFGRSYGLGNVMKPVYFSIETIELPFNEKVYDTEEQAEKAKETYGRSDLIIKQNPTTPEKYSLFTKEAYPLYLKYSSIVLSDELLEQFPYLEVIREKMESNSIDEIVFQSGVKVGSPAILSSSEDLVENVDDFTFSNTLSVDNKHFRMQLNPRHDPEDKVSMFTQITYFLNVFNSDPKVSNDPEARAVYNALAFIVKKGLEQSKKKFNNPTSLAKKLLNTPGYETALELLEADVSIDNPAIEKLLTTQFAAKLSNDTVNRVKFPGGKYTLQSAYGIYKNKLEKGDIPTEADELQYRVNPDGSLYAEMILPYGILSKEQEDAIKRGDELFLHGDGFAFRIPSTELHSAISIKVVGVYDDLKTNVIIGPKELVPLHGSDFDADSLSVVMRTRAKSNFRFMDIKLYKDDFIGYMLNDDNKYVLDPDFPEMIHNAIKQTQKFSDNNSKKMRKRLLEIQEDYAKNVIAETMMMVIRHPRNRPRMLTPISMERFNGYYGGESMLELLKKNGDPDPQKKYDVSSSEGRYMAYKSIFDGAALTGVFANAIKSLAYMIKSGPGSSGQNEMLQRINGLAATLKDAPEELKQNIEEEIERLQGEMMQYEGPSNSLPEIKEDFRLTIDGHTYTHLSEEERNEAKTSIWETMDALVNSAIDNAKEQIMFMIGANGITANAISAMVGMGIPLNTTVFFMRQPIIQELSKSKYYGRAENGIADLREQLKKKAEEDESYELTTESLAKRIQPTGTELDWDNLSKEDAKHYLAVLNQFEKAWKVGKSIEVMANYLNLVRGMPVTAEAIGKTREIIEEIGEFGFQFFDVKTIYDLQAYNGMAAGTLTTNDSFAFDIPNFLSNNPHIAVAHQVFEELEKILQTTFFVHSPIVKNFIKSLHLTGQIELAKGDKDSAILNRIQFAREFQKYLMSSIYANKFLSESTPYYYTNYKGEKEYLEGSKAWFQHFISKVQTLQKHLMKEGSDKITNYFLFNLSISGNDLKSMRYTAGSNLKYEDIILARDSFEELNKYSFKETLYEEDNPEYEVVENQDPPQFTDFQKDFIVFSILNNGLQYSITSLSQVLPPVLFKESDDQLQSVSRSVEAKEEVRNNLRDHFKLSMVAANADQLKWVPSDGEQSKLMPKGKRYVMLKGNILKELDNYAGKTEDGLYYDLSYINKAGDNASSVFPEFIRTSEGRSAIAYIRMNNPTEPIVYYQRIGKNPTGFYEMAETTSPYNMYDYFNLRIPTVHATSAKSDVITVDRSLDYLENEIFAVVDNRDITRKDRRFVKVVGEIPRQTGQQFKYEVEDAFKSKEEETEYLNGIFAEEDLHETYSITIEGKKGILKTYENEVTDAPNDIAKYVIGKDITEAQKYIKDNNWKIRLLPKKCRR